MNIILQEIATESWSWPWWGVMVAINVISCLIMICLFIMMFKDNKRHPKNTKYRITMMALGLLYCSVAMYRSVFVSSYTGQLAWFDSIANSSFVIRCLATFAEISFACLVGLPLAHLNHEVELPEKIKNNKIANGYLKASPYIIITCLCVAQFFAWTGLFTQYKVLFAIEETLWALGFTSVLPLLIIQLRNIYKNHKSDKQFTYYKVHLIVLAIFTCGYLIFQYAYQLPFTYWGQIADDFANGIHYAINGESLHRILFEYHPTRSWETWGGFAFFSWHSGYFSICVWMNIIFANGPRLLKEAEVIRNNP